MPENPSPRPDPAAARLALSALMDADPLADVGALAKAWAEDADARQTWHAYHLLGDVLRSDELACSPQRDRRLLAAVRARLDEEPAVPVSMAFQAERRRAFRWAAPAAVAASFVALAGLTLSWRGGELPHNGESTQMARSGAPAAALTWTSDAAAQRGSGPKVPPGTLLRDAQLDRYLEAHRRVGAYAATQVPGSVARNIEPVVFEGR